MTPKFKQRGFEDASQKKLANAFTIKFLNIKKFKQFIKQNDNEMYIIMFTIIIDKSSTNDHQKIEIFLNNDDNINQIFSEYFNFQNVFFEAKTNILSKHDSNDLAINTQDKKSSFNKIYNLSQFELKMLKKYITEQLNKGFIVFFKFPADVPVLFASKKDGNLCLCVDYKELNVIIIKNQHFLLLIQKTMNRLIEAKKFIKLDIQHVYNMIRIKKNDE